MKRILLMLPVMISLIGCADLDTGEEGNKDSDTVTAGAEDESLPLILKFSTTAMTKNLVGDSCLPSGSSVGITIRDNNGKYTGEDYTNIRYSSALSAGVQVWETMSPVLLAHETGTLFSYWPYSEDEVDGKMITVAATSDVQTDYMWGLPVAVSKSNRTASITMQHALSAVRIYCKRGSYTGAGEITGVAFGGDCAATGGTLDLTCGALDDLSGQGTMIAPAITAKTITSSYQKVSDIIVVPTTGTNGKVVVTLDGTDYPIDFNTLKLMPGKIMEFHLAVNNGELSASDIIIGEDWTYSNPEDSEIFVSDKVKIKGDVTNIAFKNVVSDDGTVTIQAMPTVGELSFTEVEPVTFTGVAIQTQSSDIDTGIRTITISNIETDVVIDFHGTITWDVISDFVAQERIAVFWQVYTSHSVTDISYNCKDMIEKIRCDDTDILKHDYYSYFVYDFPEGYGTVKYKLRDNYVNDHLFDYITHMVSVRISQRMEYLGNYAFRNCEGLAEVTLPSGLKSIGSYCFSEYSSKTYNPPIISNITIPEGVTIIRNNAFANVQQLLEISLPKTLKTLQSKVFYGCKSLRTIVIPENVVSIGDYCFACTDLKSITSFAKTAPVLENNAFIDMPNNGILTVPAGADYSAWMTDKNLGGKNWTLVYMNE